MEQLRFENFKLQQEIEQQNLMLQMKDKQITQLHLKVEELTQKLDYLSPSMPVKQTIIHQGQQDNLQYEDFSPSSSKKGVVLIPFLQQQIEQTQINKLETLLSPKQNNQKLIDVTLDDNDELNKLIKFDEPLTPIKKQKISNIKDILNQTLEIHKQRNNHQKQYPPSILYVPKSNNFKQIIEFLRYGVKKQLNFDEFKYFEEVQGHFVLYLDDKLNVNGIFQISDKKPFQLIGVAGISLEIDQNQVITCYSITKNGRLRLQKHENPMKDITDAVQIKQ